VTGGIKIFFGGLEFNLKDEREKGLLINEDDRLRAVNPELMTISEDMVRLGLPGGSSLIFSSLDSDKGPKLQITAELGEGVTEIAIPIVLRRASLVRENEQSLIMYGGSRYGFANPTDELERGRLVLSGERASVTYHSKEKKKTFDPEDYIIAAAQNYDSIIENWRDACYARWNQNASSLQNEDEVIAYCIEALKRGSFQAAVAAVSGNFLNSSRQSYRSSVFIGGMSGANRSFTAAENEKISRINGLAREKSPGIFLEENVLDYLFSRNNTALSADVINIMQNTQAETLISDYCPGLFEAYSDFKHYRPAADNPLEHLTEQALLLVSENLNSDSENDLLFASSSESANLEYSARLGKALINWAPADSPWAAIGRSLILSVLSNGGYGDGKLYNMLLQGGNLRPSGPAEVQADYYPRALPLSDPVWIWTTSRSAAASYIDGNLNIAFSFPVGSSHFVILKGVSPFIKIQIHDMDWRTDSQFERYDSSGWVYYSQEQTLILKLRHRSQMENVRIFYRVEAPAARPIITEPLNRSGDNIDS